MATTIVNLQTGWKADDSLEAMLERQIGTAESDFESKRKLKLLRVARLLGPSQSTVENALVHATERLVDQILCKIWGKGSSGTSGSAEIGHDDSIDKMNLWELVDPSQSPLVQGQHALCEMLLDFSVDKQHHHWHLLGAVFCDFGSHTPRTQARSQCFKIDAGLNDHFVW